ncbi:MAG: hypothetical protein AABX05_02205, partial [Nanoarchaeota archaeon]
FIAVFMLLISCKPEDAVIEDNISIQINETKVIETGCAAHWECVSDDYKAYQLENCTWSSSTKCERGCINGTCKAAEVCTVGFKCIDDDRYGYRKEDCSFINKKSCEGGCVDNKCLEKTANTTQSAAPVNSYAQENQEEEPTETQRTIRTIQLGEQQEIDIEGQTHVIQIYDLEPDKVIISVDGEKSDWLSQGDSYPYNNIGATFRIEAILFQAYGVKAIDYSFS